MNLANGGRGVGNMVESMLINPLARFLFDERVPAGAALTVRRIDASEGGVSLDCTVCEA